MIDCPTGITPTNDNGNVTVYAELKATISIDSGWIRARLPWMHERYDGFVDTLCQFTPPASNIQAAPTIQPAHVLARNDRQGDGKHDSD